MQITNCGRGVHKREVKGIDRLKKDLPPQWYGFTNLDLVLGPGKTREVDLIIVSDLRIFLIDIKDWHGRIEARDGRWYLNGADRDPSPVEKVSGTARDVSILLKNALKQRPETKDEPIPRVIGLVVLTGQADRAGIGDLERASVLTADEFIKAVLDGKKQREAFGDVARQIVDRPLTDQFWKDRLSRFFNAGTNSPFRPSRRRFQGFVADDIVKFAHPKDVYREYDAQDERNLNNLGTLRLWNFTKCDDGRFQTEEGRLEITGREQEVFQWLRDRDHDLERSLLPPKIEDNEASVHYWDIYDRRRLMQRLSDFAPGEGQSLPPLDRTELARQLLAAIAAIHRQNAAHLDLGVHSVWLQTPTTVRLSHLFAARYPDVRSLGEARFQFLSSVELPEDVLGVDAGPKRRDVFLAGVAVHYLLFGRLPGGHPPAWNPEIDSAHDFESLHAWLAESLDLDPDRRFSDGVVALEAFNKATAARPRPDEILSELDRFRGEIKSQRQLAAAYPATGEALLESDRQDMWRSTHDGAPVVVKLWKQAAWGDIRREGGTVLAFLQKANDLKADRLDGLSPLRDIVWLGDSLAIVQDWIEGDTLSQILSQREDRLVSSVDVLTFTGRLIEIVEDLHGRGFAHGDIKPANIVVSADGEPFLIDALDFSSASDGERVSTAYAPETGSRNERDRFALTKIAEELFARPVFETQTALDLAGAIRDCRGREPVLSTLSPLKEAIDRGLATLAAAEDEADRTEPDEISISIAGAEAGPIDPDEGSLFVRLEKSEWGTVKLFVRGAFEEIEFRLDQNRKPFSAWRRHLGQKAIASIAQREFYHLTSALMVSGSDVTELTGIESLLQDPLVQTRIDELLASPASRHNVAEESEAAAISDDQAEDELAEEILVAPSGPAAAEVDVPRLWRALIDVENELTTEGVAQLDSVADGRSGTHKVPIELESGEFDYARHDTVGVEKQDRKGHWRRIGDLDLRLSRPDMVFISARWIGIAPGACLVEAGQRLRFVSHFEFQSLRRRKDAVDRVLAGDGRSRDLLSAFDSRSGALPLRIDHHLDEAAATFYNLNADQKAGLEQLLSVRPVGMLQGPPGTGKTRFIAALTHYAITHGLARNVLLASQSHEAVNTAAEAVLTLFRQTGGHPSMLRVAMDELIVSPPLRPYYAARVEQSYKDKFNASFSERISVAGKAIGVPDTAVADILTLETAVRPIVARITDLAQAPEDETQRINGLIETLRHHFASLGLPDDIEVSAYDTEWDSLVDDIAQQLIGRWERSGVVNADKIERLRRVCAIGSDFVGSVSRPQRSFETFLAGTRQIVAGTCVGLGRTSLGLTNTAFDLVIVDEAARCTASELLVPLQAARWVVLVGDQAQLEPQHKPEVVELVADRTGISKQEIKTSDFERVFYTPYGREASAALKTQYRMLPPIGQVVSDAFYPGLSLLPGRHDPEIDPSALPDSLDKPLIWIETDGLATAAFDRKESSSSRVNKAEADAVIALLEQWHSHEPFREWLLNQTKHPAGVGVICMYAAQRNLIERRLRQSSMGYLLDGALKVGTVDSYQGKQNPIIILSLVRNNDSGPMEAGIKRIQEGFLSVPNRVNVAASRAMDRLVIVGARRRWRSKSPIGLFNQAFEKQIASGFASVVPVESLLDRGARTTASPQQTATEGALLSVGGAHANA